MLNNIASVAMSYLLRIKRSIVFLKKNPSKFSLSHCFQILAIASLSGCGSISAVQSFWTTYQAPESGPRAKIRVISTGMVRAVPESSCVDWRKPGAGVMVSAQKVYSNLNGQSLDMPKRRGGYLLPADAEIQISELYISAKGPLTLYLMGAGYDSGGKIRSCQRAVSFVPEPGKNYDAVLTEHGRNCLIQVDELDAVGDFESVPLQKAGLCNVLDNF